MKRKKGYYSISIVAKMFSVHQQTIRLYEKEGLVAPKRSSGNTRLFSEEDVDRLEQVIYLTHKMGVNLAGVEMILKLQKKIKNLQDDMNKMFNTTQGELSSQTEHLKQAAKKQAQRLLGMKQETEQKKGSAIEIKGETVEPEIIDDWEIEYDEE